MNQKSSNTKAAGYTEQFLFSPRHGMSFFDNSSTVRWRQLPPSHRLSMSGLVFSLALAASGLAAAYLMTDSGQTARNALGSAQLELARLAGQEARLRSHWMQTLPKACPCDDIEAMVSRAAADNAVALVRWNASTLAGSQKDLGRADILISLDGSWPAISAVLDEVSRSHPELFVAKLDVSRRPTAQVRADIVLRILLRPEGA